MILNAWSDGWFDIPARGGGAPRRVRCALGPAGVISAQDKREGDGATPLAIVALRRVLFRPDRGPPPRTVLATAPISPDDGWCDAPGDPAYNQPVKLPYAASAESMWREDGLYDLVVVLGYNDDPPRPGLGSAIFLHVAKPDYAPTQGCVALSRPDLELILALVAPGDALEIRLAD